MCRAFGVHFFLTHPVCDSSKAWLLMIHVKNTGETNTFRKSIADIDSFYSTDSTDQSIDNVNIILLNSVIYSQINTVKFIMLI